MAEFTQRGGGGLAVCACAGCRCARLAIHAADFGAFEARHR